MTNVATPLEFTITAPSVVPPLTNFIFPVGIVGAYWFGTAVAVNVTSCLSVEGFGVEVRVVVVGHFSTSTEVRAELVAMVEPGVQCPLRQ